ncbi:methyltransferase family protein [Actinomadura rugatobispora]|uniref:Methyltransferase family protein n=1 Tax=Actinomadura rugatobispora TaxID=1994 RepID=A0ABW1A6P2_9ACTN|nr:isoprenylcysteine carboxylmethyltransferase family protein [Actinomadura rugatobispora]
MTRSTKKAALVSVAFSLMPITVALLVPWWLTGLESGDALASWWPLRAAGLLLFLPGLYVIAHAFRRFVVEGLGAPLPAAAPERLVVGGFYRYVRNPMYVAILAMVLGEALLLVRPVLLVYAAVVWIVPAAYVRWREEPVLLRRFGPEYERYRRAVPAWIPRLHPWHPGPT